MPTAPATMGLPVRGYQSVVRTTPNLVAYFAQSATKPLSSATNFAMPTIFSMECWVRITSVTSNRGVFSQWSGGNSTMIWVDASNTRFKLHVNGSDIDSGVQPSANVWYHLVGTYNGTSRSLFVNGTLMGGPTSGVTPAVAATPLATHNYASSGVSDLAGTVADAAVYSRALTAAEIVAHYLAGLR